LLGILNSKFIGWYFRRKFQISPDDTFPQIMIRDILQFSIPLSPIPLLEKISIFVKNILNSYKQLPSANTDHEKNLIQRQIESTDHRIDELVYDLYGLTEEEIKIVEGTNDRK
jgi:restriction endonuclease S subunit